MDWWRRLTKPLSPPTEPQAPPPQQTPNLDSSLGVAKQPPGPKSAIVFVPPPGSLEFREATTQGMKKASEPIIRAIRLSAANGTGGDVDLGVGSHLVGRADDTAVTIRNPLISRHHALIMVTETSVTIEDLKSANGTFLNMQRLQRAVPLNAGDVVSFGSTEFTVEVLMTT